MPIIGDVRSVGLMIGLELIDADGSENVAATNHIAKMARKYGLLMRTSRYGRGNVLKIRPALNITLDEAETMCDRLEQLIRGESR